MNLRSAFSLRRFFFSASAEDVVPGSSSHSKPPSSLHTESSSSSSSSSASSSLSSPSGKFATWRSDRRSAVRGAREMTRTCFVLSKFVHSLQSRFLSVRQLLTSTLMLRTMRCMNWLMCREKTLYRTTGISLTGRSRLLFTVVRSVQSTSSNKPGNVLAHADRKASSICPIPIRVPFLHIIHRHQGATRTIRRSFMSLLWRAMVMNPYSLQ
mmetsp:Transcript_38131/g.91256  ORF Transcript_38131/g.91256 Transcript_38131/m.91256 type:complete len:211 (-) Transcript_38131:1923-2555(-)